MIREIEHKFLTPIGELWLFPLSAQILLEIRIYFKNGSYRFFRFGEAVITGIDRHGSRSRLPGRQYPC